MPQVAIVIPCRNAARWVRRCVESALAQRGIIPEVIVVDDASEDGSVETLKSFGDAIQVVPNAGRGACHARNTGLELAQTEWVQFLDADDYLLPEKVSAQLELSETEADGIYSPILIENWRGDVASPPEILPIAQDTPTTVQWIRWQLPQTGGVLWKTESLKRIGGWNPRMPCCQEHELYFRALRAGLAFEYVNAPGAVYRIWSEATLCRRDPRLTFRVKASLILRMYRWLVRVGRWDKLHRQTTGQALLEIVRGLYQIEPARAIRFFEHMRHNGLIHLRGAAAPRLFRIACTTLGYPAAERIAAWRRGLVRNGV